MTELRCVRDSSIFDKRETFARAVEILVDAVLSETDNAVVVQLESSALSCKVDIDVNIVAVEDVKSGVWHRVYGGDPALRI